MVPLTSPLDESYDDSLAIRAAQREKQLLNGMIQNILPGVGPSVRTVVLEIGRAHV